MKQSLTRDLAAGAIGALIAAGLLGLCSPWVADFWDHLAEIVLPRWSSRGILSLLATLLLCCVVQIAWIYKLTSKRLLLKKYERDPDYLGAYKHLKTGQKVCAVCLHKGEVSPLLTDNYVDLSCGPCHLAIKRTK